MYLSIVWMQINKKKLKFLWSLPRALTIALGKDFLRKNRKTGLCRGLWSRPSAKNSPEKIKKDTLPRACMVALGKEITQIKI